MGTLGNIRHMLLLLCTTSCCQAIAKVRLVDSNGEATNSTRGMVEFFFDDDWGEICYNDFLTEDSGVICRHLNFLGVKRAQFKDSQRRGNRRRHKIEISCYGHEENLHNCRHSRISENGIFRCEALSLHISCYSYSQFSVANSKVRLDGGDGSYGTVAYKPDGWKTICGESWGELEGGVVCRELGFRGVKSLKLFPWPTHETGSSAKFKCNGSEISIAECQTNKADFDDFYSFSSASESLDESVTGMHCSESIEVTCLHDIDFTSPKSPKMYEKRAEDTFTLRCNATNSTKVWWRRRNWKDDIIVENSTELHLPNISSYDLGSYTCVVEGPRGQQVESNASQTLILSNYTQVLLQTTGESSTKVNFTKIRTNCEKEFKKAQFDVSTKFLDDESFTMQLGKHITGDQSLTAITNEIDGILSDIRNMSIGNEKLPLLRKGLTFCIGEPHETLGAGILNFPGTKINSKAESIEMCVGTDRSRASRECVGNFISPAVWKDADLRNCFITSDSSTEENTEVLIQTFFKVVEATNLTTENVSAISRDLADATAIAEVARVAINDIKVVLEKITDVESAEPSVTRNVIETVDNVVNQSSGSDEILNPQASSIILQSFEKQLDTVKESGSNFTHKRPNIEVQVIQIEDKENPIKFEFFKNKNESKTKFNRNETDRELEEDLQVAVEIPSIVIRDLGENCSRTDKNETRGSLPVSFTIFLNGALFNDSTTDKKRNSLIVSTSMLCDVVSLPNGTSISTFFTPKNDTGEHPWECVFWEPSIDGDGNKTGVWSSEGCVDCGGNAREADEDACPTSPSKETRDPVEIYKCSWTHLTNFAVLLDIKGDYKNPVLDVITIVGCVISVIALLITISSYLFMKKLRSSQPKQIIIMLCSSLLGLYLTFMIGIDRTESGALCVIFGGLIHFFCLSTVAWMSVEATQLYLLLVKVVNAHVSHFMMKASAIAWGVPFIVVVVCVAAAHDAYAHEYCFPLHCSNVFYFGVLGLVALLLLYNIATYAMIVRSISAPRKNITSSQSDRAGRIRRLQNALAISVLLGLSWVFGFLAIGSVRMVFNVLFCLFNSFQGFFIFLLFCLRQAEIREAWRERFGIAICLKKEYDTTTVSEKPSTSTSRQLTRESEVSKPFFKSTEKSQDLELRDFKSIDEATEATPMSVDIPPNV